MGKPSKTPSSCILPSREQRYLHSRPSWCIQSERFARPGRSVVEAVYTLALISRPQDSHPSIRHHTTMSSFFEDLKLLHPYLKLPSSSESSAWKEKLIDSTISLDEWSAHAKLLLRDVGGTDYYSLFADTGPVTLDHDGVFGAAIIEYVRQAHI